MHGLAYSEQRQLPAQSILRMLKVSPPLPSRSTHFHPHFHPHFHLHIHVPGVKHHSCPRTATGEPRYTPTISDRHRTPNSRFSRWKNFLHVTQDAYAYQDSPSCTQHSHPPWHLPEESQVMSKYDSPWQIPLYSQ
jgi:hypothetical protein